MGDRFLRACPQHRAPLEEAADGALRCERGHVVGAWLVVDSETGATVAAGRVTVGAFDSPVAVWLGPRLEPWVRALAVFEPRAAA